VCAGDSVTAKIGDQQECLARIIRLRKQDFRRVAIEFVGRDCPPRIPITSIDSVPILEAVGPTVNDLGGSA
jgi:hypothetical protein